MLIPVCHTATYGRICGSIVYNTDNNRFLDSSILSERILPVQDYLDCSIDNKGKICTVVGRGKDSSYYVCFGDNFIYKLRREELNGYIISNSKNSINGRLLVIDHFKEGVLDYLFPYKDVEFQGLLGEVNASSIGEARKFFAKYKGNDCIIKFSKQIYNNQDLNSEIIFQKVCKILDVPCCRVERLVYYGNPCIASFFEYSVGRDCFQSFKSIGKPIKEIYDSLSREDKTIFDKMMFVDYITLQQDRHMSNIALLNGRMYPLFDNGECLGIGTIGYYSNMFAKLVENNKDYYKNLFSIDKVNILCQYLLYPASKERLKFIYDN